MKSSVSARFNADLLDEKYELWCDDPQSVENDWCAFFEGFELGNAQLKQKGNTAAATAATSAEPLSTDEEYLNFRGKVVSLVYN